MREQDIQSKIKKKMKSLGWLPLKVIKCDLSGWPDLMFFKDGVTRFIEVKKKGGVLSPLQKYRINQLVKKGFIVNVWTDFEEEF